jgi:hypothetical protein
VSRAAIIRPAWALVALLVLGCPSPSFDFAGEPSAAASTGVGGAGTAGADAGIGVAGAAANAGAAGEATGGNGVDAGAGGFDSGSRYDTGLEDCSNGLDDDRDGAADCGDANCSPFFRCVPAVPNAWHGPIALWEGEGTAPSCSLSGYFPVGQGFLPSRLLAPAEPSVCPSCSCGDAIGATCASASVTYFAAEDCSEPLAEVSSSATCGPAAVLHQGQARPRAARFAAPEDPAAACEPREEGVSLSPPVALEIARGCGEPVLGGAGCAEGHVCLPRPMPPFGARVCIYRDGERGCPVEFPAAGPLYFRMSSDSRTCRPCRCGVPRCLGRVSDSMLAACEAPLTSLLADTCTLIDIDDSAGLDDRSLMFDIAAGAACTPGPSGPTGEYALAQPVSFCCRDL